jgi:hypothetical protein
MGLNCIHSPALRARLLLLLGLPRRIDRVNHCRARMLAAVFLHIPGCDPLCIDGDFLGLRTPSPAPKHQGPAAYEQCHVSMAGDSSVQVIEQQVLNHVRCAISPLISWRELVVNLVIEDLHDEAIDSITLRGEN